MQYHERTHLINSHIISQQVLNVYETSSSQLLKSGIRSLQDLQGTTKPLISFSKSFAKENSQLRHYLYQNFYQNPSIVNLNNYGKDTIESIFSFLLLKPEHIPPSFLELHEKKEYSRDLVIGYFIAGMTDNYASRFCQIHGLTV